MSEALRNIVELIEQTMGYEIKINGINSLCKKMHIDYVIEIAYVYNLDLNLDEDLKIDFDYRRGYFKGKGIIYFKNRDGDKFNYKIKIEKYNKTK